MTDANVLGAAWLNLVNFFDYGPAAKVTYRATWRWQRPDASRLEPLYHSVKNHGQVSLAMKIKTVASQLGYNILIEKKNSSISAIYAL